jgi:hypothetical protein
MNSASMKKPLLSLLFFILFFLAYSQNNSPVAVNDTVRPVIGFPFEVNLLKNDFDPDGDSLFIPSFELFRINDSTWRIPPQYYLFPESYDSIKEKIYFLKDEHGAVSSANIVIIRRGTPKYDFLDINNIKALISPFGNHFWDGENSMFEVPKGSGKSPIFNHTFWIGGVNQNGQFSFAGEYYRQSGIDFSMGPVSSVYDTTYPLRWNRVWKIDKDQILAHRDHWNEQGYTPAEVIVNWPAHGSAYLGQSSNIAPFHDSDQDGRYEPFEGEYPLIRGDQAVFFILNDLKTLHTESYGRQMGIEIHAMAYAYDQPQDSALNNMIFFHYEILNLSQYTYLYTMMGLFNEFDLGNVNDDFLGCDVTSGLSYVYNGDAIDGNGEAASYGEHPPAFGLKLIGGPFLPKDGIDNEKGNCDEGINGFNFGDHTPDNERLGLSYCVPVNSNSEIGGIASDCFNKMRAIRIDGQPYMYGDSMVSNLMFGYDFDGGEGPACRYFYPGDSDTLCNWGTSGQLPIGGFNINSHYWTDSLSNNYGDRRGLSSTGPFIFEPNEKIPLDYCFLWSRDYQGDHLSSVELLRERIINLSSEWPQLIKLPATIISIPESENISELTIHPNPTYHSVSIILRTNSANHYQLFNIEGSVVYSGKLLPGKNNLDLSFLDAGIYLLNCRNKTYKIVKL